MRVLVVGGGGREHALAWAIRREIPEAVIHCAPGNPGTAELGTNLAIPADDIDRVTDAADMLGADLVVVGPEVPLAMGLADRIRAEGRMVFGPSAAAARIESSKSFAKDVMRSARVPTAASETFTSLQDALKYIDRHTEPLVVKASGLAAGKGAIVAATRKEAADAARAMLEDSSLGAAGSEIVVESFLEGEELSLFAITNGKEVVLLPAAQDHKRLLEGDRGPNTGGMGAYAPVSLATNALITRATDEVLLPTLAELERRGTPFRGLLYAGLMIDAGGAPSVVEFNCRFGDPETQAVLPLLDGSLVDALVASASGSRLPSLTVNPNLSAVTTVLAARGYPNAPEKGAEITLPVQVPEGVTIFHAGTKRDDAGVLRTSGGRVFAVTGVAGTFSEARSLSSSAAEAVKFEGKQYRRDIGWREARRTAGG